MFGDLHGKVLPAFRLAMAWSRETATPVAGILQVGDLGYFPDHARLDPATARIAQDDPLELGVQLVTEPSPEADAVFLGGEREPPRCLWFCPGNHEDFEALGQMEQMEQMVGSGGASFQVDAYARLRCIRDGEVETLPGSLRVGALWGIDDAGRRSTRLPGAARIRPRRAIALAASAFDILLTHDGPRDAIRSGSGSEAILDVIRGARPAFAFFGHYEVEGGEVPGEFGPTRVFHLGGFKIMKGGGHAEPGSVGVLRWWGNAGQFEYLDPDWLWTFTRRGWQGR